MFNNHEALKCEDCGDTFMGRRPIQDGHIFCYKCRSSKKIPLINIGDNVPQLALEEHMLGGGENGRKN